MESDFVANDNKYHKINQAVWLQRDCILNFKTVFLFLSVFYPKLKTRTSASTAKAVIKQWNNFTLSS